ncbi:MAG: hypothetical protein JXO51_03220 [Candidatus Aminicenantes bacterium]|nr:hypothetical protein [Candidatus Aminicenantes bacterium]
MRRAVSFALAAPVLLLAVTALFPPPAAGADLRSQLSGWFSLNNAAPSTPRLGLRWQPSLSLDRSLGAGWKLDAEMTMAASVALDAPSWRCADAEGTLDPYRLWLRLSSRRFEARLGLQKINFGSATVFRPLMWFDRIDPRDPLQLTDGVTGLLLRYFFRGNTNLWLWGLYGNDEPKGWETLPTARRSPEFGGRFQAPFFSGEAAASAHFRRVADGTARTGESRFALDGKWDLGFGLWVEASLVHGGDSAEALPWQHALALGVDYTFPWGNGLYMMAEQFLVRSAPAVLGAGGNGASFSALLARYPLGLLDSLNAVFYYDWRNGQAYNFASWQRTTDRWQFHLMAFWNPRQSRLVPAQAGDPQVPEANTSFAGRGFQLMAVWNI